MKIVLSFILGALICIINFMPEVPKEIDTYNRLLTNSIVEEYSYELLSEEEMLKINLANYEPQKTNRWDITLTENEFDLLCRLVYHESGNQCLDGQQAVTEVILNRVYSDKFPNTLEEVVFQKNPTQFTAAKNLYKYTPTEETINLVREVLEGKENILDIDYLFFARSPITQNEVKQIEDHYFSK